MSNDRNIDWSDTRLHVSAEDGSPFVPLAPHLAKSRLALLTADDSVVDALLDASNPSHRMRVAELSALNRVIAGQGTPRSPIEQANDLRAAKFGAGIQTAVDQHVASVTAAGRAERDAQ